MPKEQKVLPINKYSIYELKAGIDKEIQSFLEEEEFVEIQKFSNVKILFGLLTVACTGTAYLYPLPFPQNYYIILFSVIGYLIFSTIYWYIDKKIIDMIQLHGNESDEYIKELKEKVDVPIINVYRISEYADYVLYDGKNPGSGEVFDYKDIDTKKPFFIAGGINTDNVFEFKKLNAYCIDTSSGVEVNGFKDFSKMEEFIRRVRL